MGVWHRGIVSALACGGARKHGREGQEDEEGNDCKADTCNGRSRPCILLVIQCHHIGCDPAPTALNCRPTLRNVRRFTPPASLPSCPPTHAAGSAG